MTVGASVGQQDLVIADYRSAILTAFSKGLAVTLFLCAMTLSTSAQAAGLWDPVTVYRLSVDSNGTAYVRVAPATPNSGSSIAACSTNGFWNAAFDSTTPAGQAMLSMAISAKLSKSQIRLIGTGTCTVFASIEDLSHIDLLPDN